MSVVVKGMKMPENCIACPLQFGGWCYASPPEIDERVAPTVDEAWEQGKPDWCPLVALPDHHGRLVDADALLDEVMDRHCNDCDRRKGNRIKDGKYGFIYAVGDAPCRACEVDDFKDQIEDAPTIEFEIIHCKDCKHWSRESICDGFCSEDCMRHDENFYCGYAGRRTNE